MLCFSFVIYSDGISVTTLLHGLHVRHLPVNTEESQRIIIRRKHVWEDALRRFKSGLNVKKYIKVTFVGEPAVDYGGPLREFFHILISEISQNNYLFCGDATSRVPMHNMTELTKRTYYFVGVMVAMSLVHGGPAPKALLQTTSLMEWLKSRQPLLMSLIL